MNAAGWTLVAFAVVLVINLVPYFMPPTWAVVSFFLVARDGAFDGRGARALDLARENAR